MNILVFSLISPYPVLTGLELRIYHLARALSRRNSVSLVCIGRREMSGEERKHLEDTFASVDVIESDTAITGSRPRSMLEKLRAPLKVPWDWFESEVCLEQVREVIGRRVQTNHIEGFYVFGWSVRKYFEGFDDMARINDIIDDPSVLHRRMIGGRTTLLDKARAYKEWLVSRRFVKQEMGQFRHAVMVSSEDARVFHELAPKVETTPIPNGVDAEYFTAAAAHEPSEPALLFSGVMDYEPNIRAAVYLCNEIFPLIRRKCADATLTIAGRYPTGQVRALAVPGSGITVTGEVTDMRDCFNQAQIYVCPLKSGAGIKNKILESWAMETPVVATSISCEGIDVSPGEDILVADTPSDLAAGVMQLLENAELREKLARNGRMKVQQQYSWDSRAAMVEEIFERLRR